MRRNTKAHQMKNHYARVAKWGHLMDAYIQGSEIQYENSLGVWETCRREPNWDLTVEYRIEPPKPLQIPWDLIGEEYQWAAKDKDGDIYLWREKPHRAGSVWRGSFYQGLPLVNLDPHDTPWYQSLVQRPTK